MVIVPLSMFRVCSALIASLTGAWIVRLTFRMVSEAVPSSSVVAPDLMPFFPLAMIFSVPEPEIVTWEPSLHLRTAFSASALSG